MPPALPHLFTSGFVSIERRAAQGLENAEHDGEVQELADEVFESAVHHTSLERLPVVVELFIVGCRERKAHKEGPESDERESRLRGHRRRRIAVKGGVLEGKRGHDLFVDEGLQAVVRHEAVEHREAQERRVQRHRKEGEYVGPSQPRGRSGPICTRECSFFGFPKSNDGPEEEEEKQGAEDMSDVQLVRGDSPRCAVLDREHTADDEAAP
mmetsp:Transcript_25020/g.34286  ORF Transcript_25020/g.34286 Transcript_25020/m.34286 type:complete len:211 (+) Transcript_25020:1607-2239(+)